MIKTGQVLDKQFEISIDSSTIQKRINEIAEQINQKYANQEVFFIGILNGSFMFFSDLLKKINVDCQISFLKVASYQGTSTTGSVKKLIGLTDDISNKNIIIVEDIIDTGITMESILQQIYEHQPKVVEIATLLYKPNAFEKNYKLHYIGFEIPNDFVVGYGLDYNGLGRNLDAIYKLKS